ncbi:hypothetical protein D5086_033831 [Populus alba]|uniref:Uncharacterized protein n=1 Tax=Populus alba TaxID=43335 RepID=A0ACC4AI15_POPAL
MYACPHAAHAYTFKHAGSGHKRRRGSAQPSSSRAGKKSKRDIDRDHRVKKKKEVEKLKAEVKELEKSKCNLEGQASILEKLLNVRIEENTKQKIELQRQSDSILELEKKLIALGEHHQQEIQALKELCWCRSIDMGTPEMVMQH